MNILAGTNSSPRIGLYSLCATRGNWIWSRIKTFMTATIEVGWNSQQDEAVGPRNQQKPAESPSRRTADRLAATLDASAAIAEEERAREHRSTLHRVVDLRIPLWGIITAAASIVGLLINMWLTVQQLSATMKEVQITLSAGNITSQTNAVELATIRIRQENADRALRDLQQQVQNNSNALQTNRR